MYINTNVAALFAQNSLSNTQNTLSSLQQQMSTGLKINSPSNNPSGLAISNLMQGEIGGINSAINNATAATNLLNVANGGMQTDVQIVQQIQQLAVQASNSTNNSQDTQDIQNQIGHLLNSLDNVRKTLNYNGQAVLNQGATTTLAHNSTITSAQIGADSGNIKAGAYTVSMYYATTSSGVGEDVVQISKGGSVVATGTVTGVSTAGTQTIQLVAGENGQGSANNSFVFTVNQAKLTATSSSAPVYTKSSQYAVGMSVAGAHNYEFQTGPYQGSGNNTQVQLGSFSSATLGLSNLSVTSANGAQYAISQAKRALSMLTNAQGQVGAQVDQLNYTVSNLQTESTNLQSSQSNILDANMASVTSKFAQQQILMQTGIQALQTAQQMPQLVLKLLS